MHIPLTHQQRLHLAWTCFGMMICIEAMIVLEFWSTRHVLEGGAIVIAWFKDGVRHIAAHFGE